MQQVSPGDGKVLCIWTLWRAGRREGGREGEREGGKRGKSKGRDRQGGKGRVREIEI